jgi:hypothetical protein
MKMKPKFLIATLSLISVVALAEFKIDWWSIGGGGGPSTGGVWTVTGSIEPVAGNASGGGFVVTGGFWSVVGSVATPGAPQLIIERQGSNVRIAWPRSAEAFALQETLTLNGAPAIPWTDATYARTTNASQISVTIPSPTGFRYFRLQKP